MTVEVSGEKLMLKTMDQRPDPVGLSAHDLRHHLSLLACDLRLTRDRLAEGHEELSARARSLAALLKRLDDGLSWLLAAASGRESIAPTGIGPALEAQDLSPLIETLWMSFLRAGRLQPQSASLALERPLRWPGPRARWQSLVLNLLENACKAAPAGPVSLRADAKGLSVSNGGSLPSPALVADLAAGRVPAPSADGHGQGLALILGAARALKLRVEPELDAERFTCRFSREAVRGPALLLIEDDEDLRTMLAEYLRAEGFRVDVHTDGAALIPAPGRYAAVVADRHLPGGGGPQELARWRAADPTVITVLLTGDSEALSRSWPAVSAVLIKPGLGRLRELLAPLLGEPA